LKILVFIDWYKPGYKSGGPVRSLSNLVSHLKSDYDFSIVTRNTEYCENVPYPNIKSDEWNNDVEGSRIYYISKEMLKGSTMKKLLNEESYDFVYINGIYSWFFSIIPLVLVHNQNMKVIVASRGMLSSGSVNIKLVKKHLFIFFAKRFNLFKEVVFQATSKQEALDIKKNLGEKSIIHSAPNLTEYITLVKPANKSKQMGELNLFSIARISPEKNLHFALQCLKGVKGDVRFDIYGTMYNQDYWKICESIIEKLPPNIKIVYHGSIPSEEIANSLVNSHFLFMPSTGENFGHVIYESLAFGCPVIISDQTPWNNLGKQGVGWDIELDDDSEFTKQINHCVDMNQDVYATMQHSSWKYALKFSDNLESVNQNRKLFTK